jgi:hypothetical protein
MNWAMSYGFQLRPWDEWLQFCSASLSRPSEYSVMYNVYVWIANLMLVMARFVCEENWVLAQWQGFRMRNPPTRVRVLRSARTLGIIRVYSRRVSSL